MRIISKTKDYYDSCTSHGIDPLAVWVRETASLPLAGSSLESIPVIRFYGFAAKTQKGARHYSPIARLIVFCGKIYPCIELNEVDPSCNPITSEKLYYYRPEDFEEKVVSLGKSLDEVVQRYLSEDWSSRGKALFYSWFDSLSNFNQKALNWAVESNTVCAVFPVKNPNSEQTCDALILRNPPLKDYQFYKVFSAPLAFQEISMFVGGVLPSSNTMPIQISDKDRLLQHGFDKHSFRKQKGA